MNSVIEKLLKSKEIDKSDLISYISNNPNKRVALGILIEADIITKESLYNFFLNSVKSNEINFSDIDSLDKEGIDSLELYKFIATRLNIDYIEINDKELDSSLLDKIPISLLIKNRAVVIEENDLHIVVAVEDPLDLAVQDFISRYFSNKIVKVGLSRASDIKNILLQIETYESLNVYVEDVKRDLARSADIDDNRSPAVLKLIELILKSSIAKKASDIHIEVSEKNCIVRDRVDGMLQQRFIFDKVVFGPLSSRIKLLAELDIAERRKPQDGRFSSNILNKEYDFRVSTLPTLLGESIVMRILDKTKALMALENMGMNKISFNSFSSAISSPYGIVLVTGPTGSGKTTTLYGALNSIKSVKDKIITVEDPVEYQMGGIQQVQVNSSADLTFASILRSILRQDPDKIMIGEIRDNETLKIAIQAAMTGHLVLSTLHTNNAISAIYRMIDMGIESYLVSGSLIAIQAQRLVRKICLNCKVEYSISAPMMESIKPYLPDDKSIKFYKGEGCRECFGTGYSGRDMISEVLTINNKLARLIAAEEPIETIEKEALADGFITMFEDGIIKVLSGTTTVEEIFRVAKL